MTDTLSTKDPAPLQEIADIFGRLTPARRQEALSFLRQLLVESETDRRLEAEHLESIASLGLSRRSFNALWYGYDQIRKTSDLCQFTEIELKRMGRIGKVVIADIKDRLAAHGLSLRAKD
jgi:DNA-directed RNA polymerase alpha subunit